MKIKTTELAGDALRWAVATCEGFEGLHDSMDGNKLAMYRYLNKERTQYERRFLWSLDYVNLWELAGPIIKREGISTGPDTSKDWWLAHIGTLHLDYGPTPLIAAMRCYVASNLGDEVDVPDELVQP